jgi:GH15 family glucan-1,4-alpha-glucosidase
VRDEIFYRIMQRGWNDSKQAFVQHEETDVLDASVLLMPLVGFISPTDTAGCPRSRRSLKNS